MEYSLIPRDPGFLGIYNILNPTPEPPLPGWQRCLDSALRALLHQVELEVKLWPAAPSQAQQLASLIAPFSADKTAGPIAGN